MDQITTYSAGVVGLETIEESWDGKTYWLKAKMTTDPQEVVEALKKFIHDERKTKDLEEARRKGAELTEEVVWLKRVIAELKQPTKKIEQEYQNKIKSLNAIEWFEKGFKALIANDWEGVIFASSQAIELEPQSENAYNNRGIAYLSSGKPQKAVEDFQKVIELNTGNPSDFANLGVAYEKLSDFQRALNAYSKALEINPGYVSAYLNRGNLYRSTGNKQQAINEFSRAIEINPEDAEPRYNHETGYGMTGNYQQALHDFNRAIECKPDYADAYYNR